MFLHTDCRWREVGGVCPGIHRWPIREEPHERWTDARSGFSWKRLHIIQELPAKPLTGAVRDLCFPPSSVNFFFSPFQNKFSAHMAVSQPPTSNHSSSWFLLPESSSWTNMRRSHSSRSLLPLLTSPAKTQTMEVRKLRYYTLCVCVRTTQGSELCVPSISAVSA